MRNRRLPDAWVTATDRNGRVLARIEFNSRHIDYERLDRAKQALIERFGKDNYFFVNNYA